MDVEASVHRTAVMQRARARRVAKADEASSDSASGDQASAAVRAASTPSTSSFGAGGAAVGEAKPFVGQLRQHLTRTHGAKAGMALTVACMSQLTDLIQQLSPADAEALLAGLEREAGSEGASTAA